MRIVVDFEDCFNLLKMTSNPFVHFQICKLLKNIFIQNFQNIKTERNLASLTNLIKDSDNIPYYVENSMAEVFCLVNKISSSPDDRYKNICTLTEELLSSAPSFLKKRGYIIMKDAIAEMSNDSMNFAFGIRDEKQKAMKLSFQNNELKRFLIICASSLNQFCQMEVEHWIELVPSIASVMCDLFSWNFLVSNSTSAPSWQDIIIHHNLPEMFFNAFTMVRPVSHDKAVNILQCMVHLASTMNDANQEPRSGFFSKVVMFTLSCLSIPNLNEKEVVGLSTITLSLITRANSEIFLLEKPLLLKFLSVKAEVTCFLCQFSTVEDNILVEALDNFLHSWFTLLNTVNTEDDEVKMEFKFCSEKIFRCYLKGHMAAPEGDRKSNGAMTKNLEKYHKEMKEGKDEVLYSDHSFIVGMLGRLSIGENLSLILQCLFSKIEKLKECFLEATEKHLRVIYEDIHWILLLLIELMSDKDDAYSIIPGEVMNFLQSQPNANIMDPMAHTSSELVSIMHWIGMFCSMQVEAHRVGHLKKFSSLMEASFLIFVTKFSSSYILYNEENYSELSMSLATMFGCGSEYSSLMVQQLLEKVHFNLKVWSAKEEVIYETLNLLQDISINKEKSKICLASRTFWEIVKDTLDDQYEPMEKGNKIKLLRIIFSMLPLSNRESPTNLEAVFQVVEGRLREMSCAVQNSTISTTVLSDQLSHWLHYLTALLSSNKHHNEIYSCFGRWWNDIITMVEINHGCENVFEETFGLYIEASQYLIPLLGEEQAADLLQSFVQLVKIYSNYYGGLCRKETIEVFYLIETVFSNMLAVDFEGESRFNFLLTTALGTIIPLIDESIFEYPEVAMLFSSSMSTLAHKYVKLFQNLTEGHCRIVIFLVEHALSGACKSEVTESYLDFIKLFVKAVAKVKDQQHNILQSLAERFLEIVFCTALFGNINSDIYDAIGHSLTGLALFPQVYQRIASEIAQRISYRPSFSEKFDSLLGVLQSLNNSRNKLKTADLESVQIILFDIRRIGRM